MAIHVLQVIKIINQEAHMREHHMLIMVHYNIDLLMMMGQLLTGTVWLFRFLKEQ